MPHTQVAIPGLLSLLSEEQRTVMSALAGLDGDGPRTVPEAAALLDTDKELIAFHMAAAARTLLRGVTTPAPDALRLLGSFPAENVALWHDDLVTAEHIVYAFFDRRFPARLHLNVVTLWSGGNAGQEYHAGVRVLDSDGELLDRAEAVIEGGQGQVNQILLLEPVMPQAGRHRVEIWLDGAPLYAYPLYLHADTPEEDDRAAA
jgi:hypothetical protein